MLLQAAELTKAATDAAGHVQNYASSSAFTALLYALVLLFGGLAAVLGYRAIWQQRWARAEDVEALRVEFRQMVGQQVLTLQGDIARVVSAVDRLTKTADTLATMSERQEWHGRDIDRHEGEFKDIHRQLQEIRKDLTDLYRATPKSA